MAEDLSRLRAKRGHLKAAITRIENFVDNLESFTSASAEDLEARRSRLVSTFKEYEDVNLEISFIDPKDQELIEHVETQYYKLTAKLASSSINHKKK